MVLVLIIAALSAYLLMRSFDRTHYQLPEISSLDPAQITKIEISKNDTLIVLKKKDDRWYLDPQGYSADANRVKEMLKVFETFRLTALVSEAKDYNRYDLDGERRIGVKAWLGDTLQRNFDIGKTASSFRHTFVRLDGDSRVFHASDSFRSKFEPTADGLRDKNVLSFKAADIHEIQIIKKQKTVQWARRQVAAEPAPAQSPESGSATPPAVKFEWQSSDGKKGNDQNINRLLTTLADLRCEKYINGRDNGSFSDPIYTVRLRGARDFRLDIFAKLKADDNNHPAVSSENDSPFFLSDSQVQQIMKDPEEFLKKDILINCQDRPS